MEDPVSILSLKKINLYASEFKIIKSSANLDKCIAQTAEAYKKSIAKSLSETVSIEFFEGLLKPNFLSDLNINNLDIYFDPNFDLAKKFKMRGLPTSILINKNGKEFARIIGEIDFDTPRFKRFLRDNS